MEQRAQQKRYYGLGGLEALEQELVDMKSTAYAAREVFEMMGFCKAAK